MGSSMHISYRMTAAVWSKRRPRSHWSSQDLLSSVLQVQCMCQKGSEMCDWISLHNGAGPHWVDGQGPFVLQARFRLGSLQAHACTGRKGKQRSLRLHGGQPWWHAGSTNTGVHAACCVWHMKQGTMPAARTLSLYCSQQ